MLFFFFINHVLAPCRRREHVFCFVTFQITSCLSDVSLDSERQRMARELSGCQKRRLSLAMALLADTKVKVVACSDENGR